MRILFVNDDGYDAKGLHAVADLFKRDCEIAVVAPDVQKSGYSHAITLKPNALRYRKADGYDYDVYAVEGTPVDCVKLALARIFQCPDLVVSGINRGRNLGIDILYSGTVGAALDAASLGYRSIALSLLTKDPCDEGFGECARFFKKNIRGLYDLLTCRGMCLNVNYPAIAPKGVRVVKMNSLDTYKDMYDGIKDEYFLHGKRDYSGVDLNTDEALCLDGYITITPLTADRTDYGILKKIKREKFEL